MVTESFLPTINGVTNSVCRVAEQLDARGHDVLVLAPAPAPLWFGRVPVHTVSSVTIRQFPTGLPVPRVTALMGEFAPDVVHLASPFVVGAKGMLSARALDIPTVAVYQTDMARYLADHRPGRVGAAAARAAWRWVRWVHEQVEVTLAPSTAAVTDLVAHGVPRVRHWGRGVDTALFNPAWRSHPATLALRERLAPNGEVLVGYVGRVAAEKGLERLAGPVCVPGVRLVVVGDGPARESVQMHLTAAATAAGAAPPAFLGFRVGADLAAAYGALDVFVSPSSTETFGQTLQEAAAAALPVVALAAGGATDLVLPDRTGILVDPQDASGLTRAVAELAADPARRLTLGTAGAERMQTRTWATCTEQLVHHYEAAIRSRPRAATRAGTAARDASAARAGHTA